jgi:acyl-CoA synthetase (AMP-forming)/AMP-acid ligase II
VAAHGSNIAGALGAMAALRGDAPAIFVPQDHDRYGRRRYVHLTWRQLEADAARIAAGLGAHGVGRGSRVALLVRPSVELFSLMFALFRAGAVPVLIDPGIGARRMGRALAEAEPEAFIGIPAAHLARLLLGWGRASVRRTVVVGPGAGLLAEVGLDAVRAAGDRAGPAPVVAAGADEAAALLFTSGSTGAPKGVHYRHGNFMAQVELLRQAFDIRPGEVDLPTFPPFALFDAALGMTTVIPDMDPTRPARVNPLHILEAVRDFGVTNLFGSPALLDTLSRYGAATGARLDSVRRVISAGAPVHAAILARTRAMLPAEAEIWTPYGATESLPVAVIEAREVLDETAAATARGAGVCVGRPVPGVEVHVIAIDDGPIARWSEARPLPPGEVGELVVRSAVTTTHYHGRPEATALAKIAAADGGVLHRMGDVGYLDASGRLWFCGRKDHRVRAAAGDLYSVPAEGIVQQHPAVWRAALVGVGAAGQQRPVVCVELEPGQRAGPDLVAELRALTADAPQTAGVEAFLVHPGFPVDIRHNAKIDRPALARWAAARLGR